METLIAVLIILAIIVLLVGLVSGRLKRIIFKFFDSVTIDIHSNEQNLASSSNRTIEQKKPLEEKKYIDGLRPKPLPPPSDVASPSNPSKTIFMSDEDMVSRFAEFHMNLESGDEFEVIDRTIKGS